MNDLYIINKSKSGLIIRSVISIIHMKGKTKITMTRWIDIQAHVSLLTIQVCKALHHRRNYIEEQIFFTLPYWFFGRDPWTILSLFTNHISNARKVWGFYNVISSYSPIYIYSPVISVLFCYLVQIRPEHINRTSVNRNERKLLEKS